MQERDRVEVRSRAAWRSWLAANHASSAGCWVVYRRTAAREPGDPTYEDLVEEALCFGWVDSRPGAVDDRRTSLYVSPRTPRSGWARSNKERVARLAAAGLLEPAGLAAIDAAKMNGAWSLIDGSENAEDPADFVAALERRAGAIDGWRRFTPGTRRMLLQRIEQARRPETRARRIEETAAYAERGEPPPAWTPKETRTR